MGGGLRASRFQVLGGTCATSGTGVNFLVLIGSGEVHGIALSLVGCEEEEAILESIVTVVL